MSSSRRIRFSHDGRFFETDVGRNFKDRPFRTTHRIRETFVDAISHIVLTCFHLEGAKPYVHRFLHATSSYAAHRNMQGCKYAQSHRSFIRASKYSQRGICKIYLLDVNARIFANGRRREKFFGSQVDRLRTGFRERKSSRVECNERKAEARE